MSKANTINFKIALIVTIFCLLTGYPAAANISLSTEVSQSQIPFESNDTLSVILSWSGPPFAYQIDQFPQPDLEKFMVMGSSSSVSSRADSTQEGGEITTRIMRYVLQPIDYGTGVIHPMTIKATNKATGEVQDLMTGKITVAIDKPIPRKVDNSSSSKYLVIIAVITVFGGGIGIILIRRRKQRSGRAEPDLKYVDRLDEIKKDTASDNKLFYARLYRLLVDYLDKEQGLPLSGKTGQEVLDSLNGLEDEDKFMSWLNQALEIKYRPNSPTSGEVEATYQDVLTYLKEKA